MIMAFLFFMLPACGIFKPDKQGRPAVQEPVQEEVTRVRVYNPSSGQYELVPESEVRVDTVRLRDVTRSSAPPITEAAPVREGEMKEFYTMSLLMPFNAIRYQRISDPVDARGRRFIQYYAGARLAVDDLMREGYRIDLNVFDTEESNAKMESLLDKPEVRGSDLVVGGYRRSNIEAMARFSAKRNKAVVSPWIPGFDTGTPAPGLVQVMPGLEAHAGAICAYIRRAHADARVFLVGRDTDAEMNRLEMFYDASLASGMIPDSVDYLLIRDQTSDLKETDWSTIFGEEDEDGERTVVPGKAVFIIPYYTRSDEGFVNSVLRKIHAERWEKEVVVFGLPQWLGFTNLNYDYLESLRLHLSTISFTDRTHPKYASFQDRFFDRYGIVPEDPAFQGYDLVYSFGKELHDHGTEFLREMTGQFTAGINLGFQLEPLYPSTGPDRPAREKPTYIENRGIRILRFESLQYNLLPR